MKSVRLDPAREARLKQAAAAAGVTESEFIRRAIDRACGEATGESLYDRIKDLIGLDVPGPAPDVASDTSKAFLDMLVEQEKHNRR